MRGRIEASKVTRGERKIIRKKRMRNFWSEKQRTTEFEIEMYQQQIGDEF